MPDYLAIALVKRTERMYKWLFKKSAQVDTSIEPHPYHPRDLKKPPKGSLLYEIIKTGKVMA
jgi:hypothetical protein